MTDIDSVYRVTGGQVSVAYKEYTTAYKFYFHLGQQVAELRRDYSMSQRRLAQLMGLHQSIICKLENGYQVIEADMHIRMVYHIMDEHNRKVQAGLV